MKAIFTLLFSVISIALSAQTLSTGLVISEAYGGAGCGTPGCSTYQNDFIEIHNLSGADITISGYSVQYSSSAGTTWSVTPLPGTVTIQAGGYYLIAESFNANGVSPLPTPNATGTIAMSATAFKVALVSNTTALTGGCPIVTGTANAAGVIDFLGVGTATCSETAAAPAPSTTTSSTRQGGGNMETNSNAADFTSVAPTPQSSGVIVLPVTLQEFTVSKKGDLADLRWLVNCTSVSVTFELQRSSDGINFNTFYTATELQARCAAPFNYTDANLKAGKNFYRLKSTDSEGKVSYSGIKLIVKGTGDRDQLSIRPSVVSVQAEVYYSSPDAQKMQWVVSDMQGRILQNKTTAVTVGENKIVIPAAGLPAGSYLLKGFGTSGNTAAASFIKQ